MENNEIKIKKFDEDSFKKAFGIWKNVKDSVKYVRDLRKEWEHRAKRLKLLTMNVEDFEKIKEITLKIPY